MALSRRLSRLEARLRPPTVRDSDRDRLEYLADVWKGYARPGDPPLPDKPISEAEILEVIDVVYAVRAWALGEGPEPPPVRRPPYLVDWLETGRVAHPFLRFVLTGACGGPIPDADATPPLPPDEECPLP